MQVNNIAQAQACCRSVKGICAAQTLGMSVACVQAIRLHCAQPPRLALDFEGELGAVTQDVQSATKSQV